MNEQHSNRSRSPFSELSFSEQQEMWRVWRAQPLEYRDIQPEPEVPKAVPAPIAPPQLFAPPSHKNLDSIHARIAHAAAHAGSFKPFT